LLIFLHPNTEALDASGNGVPFGTKLLKAIGMEVVPEDADGVTRQRTSFPGLKHGLHPLKVWCDRILLLFNDFGRWTNTDQNQHLCSQLDILIIS